MQDIPSIEPSVAGTGIPTQILRDEMFHREMGHISRHSFAFFLGTLFTTGLGYVFKVYLARVLGAEALGLYALGMTIIGLLGVFNSFGLPQSAVRFVAAYRATAKVQALRNFIGRSISLLTLSNIALGALLLWIGPVIAARFYHAPALKQYFGLFASIMLLGALSAFLGQVLTGYKDVLQRTVITNFIGTPLTMAMTVGLVTWGLGLRGYILAQVFSAALVLVLLGIAVAKLTPSGGSFRSAIFSRFEKQVVSFSTFALGVSLLEYLMAQSDKILIGFYLDARAVGIYSVAGALVSFVAILLQSVNQIFSPTIADLHARNEHATLARIFQTLAKWSFGLTLPLAAVMIIFAPVLMHIFGRDFEAGWPILVIGTIGQLVNCAVGSVGYLLLMSGHQRDLVKVQVVMAVLMVGVGIMLIPKMGILGAAIGSALTNLISNLWYLAEVRRKLHMTPYNLSYMRLLIPTAIMIFVLMVEHKLLLGRYSDLFLILAGLLGAYVSFIGTAIIGGLNSDDRLILDAVWSKVGRGFSLEQGTR